MSAADEAVTAAAERDEMENEAGAAVSYEGETACCCRGMQAQYRLPVVSGHLAVDRCAATVMISQAF